MKVVIVGGTGRLGREVHKNLPGSLVMSSTDVDFTYKGVRTILRGLLDTFDPDVVVNCSGMNNVDLCERDPVRSYMVNAQAPFTMASWCRGNDRKMVHISTNYVYPNEGPHYFDSAVFLRGQVNVYGSHKARAEVLVEAALPGSSLIIRTAALFGGKGKAPSFVEKLLAAVGKGSVISVRDCWTNPTYTPHLGMMIADMVERNITGVWNVCGNSCTYYEFARALFDNLGYKNIEIGKDYKSRPGAAERPSVKLIPTRLLPWEAGLRELRRSYE